MRLSNKNKFENVRKVTSCDGAVNWLSSPTILGKSLWSLLILVCLGFAIWQVYELFSDFISEPHYRTTTYSRNLDQLEFPNLVLCNFNRAHRRRAIALGMTMENDSTKLDPDYLNYFYKAFPTAYLLSLRDDSKWLVPRTEKGKITQWKDKFEAWQVRQNLTYMSPVDLLHEIGLQCNEMVLECVRNFEELNCCKNAEPIETVHGLCWSLNIPDFVYGAGETVSLLMVPRLNSYTPEVVENNYLEEGLIIGISFDPHHYKVRNPVTLRPGTSTKVSMRSLVYLHPKPKYEIFSRDCTENGKLTILKGTYSYEYCWADCSWVHINDTCGCIPISAVQQKNAHYCDAYQQLSCVTPTVFQLEDFESSQYKYRACVNKCKSQCAAEQYVETSAVTGKFPAPRFVAGMKQRYANLNQFWLRDHIEEFIHVEIFFSSMSQLVTEEIEKVPIFNLVGSLGGQLGLWLGISILTMVQAVVYLASCAVCNNKQQTINICS